MSDWFARLFVRDGAPTWFFAFVSVALVLGEGYVLVHFLRKYW